MTVLKNSNCNQNSYFGLDHLLAACFILFLGALSTGQTASQESSIDNQFDQVIEESNDFQDYKVVKKSKLNDLRKLTNDKIGLLNDSILDKNSLIVAKDKRIAELNSNLEATKNTLKETNLEKSSMQFVGIQTTKSVYNLIVWSIIIGLTIILFVFIFKFKRSNTITKNSLQQLKSTEEELEDLRKRSIEKEQKLGRELQNERNKLARLKSD
jgi:preprotein translocase subunit SecF